MSLYIGNIQDVRSNELEDIFRQYGELKRCDVKQNGFGFVEFHDKRDAEDAIENENGKYIQGQRMKVEWSKGSIRRSDECFRCGEPGHFARDCPRNGDSYGSKRKTHYSKNRRRDYSPSRSRSKNRSYSRTPEKKYRNRNSPRRRSYSRSPQREYRRRSPREYSSRY